MKPRKKQDVAASKRANMQKGAAAAFSREAYVPAHGSSLPTKKLNRKRIVIIVCSVLVLAAVAAAIWAATFIFRVSDNIKLPEETLKSLEDVMVAPVNEEPFYVLVIGSDSRELGSAGSGRSDTMMLVRVDSKDALVTVLSIPRDIEIDYDVYGSVKINAAFAYDGPAGAVKAVSQLCDVQISHYAEIDFEGVIALVDTVGGIDVDVPMDISLDGVFISAGQQHLNGAQALIMSRCREFVDGDLTRVKNQQLLVKAVAKKILAASPTQIPSLVEELSKCLATDMQPMSALNLVNKLKGMDTDGISTATVPTWFNSHDGVSYLGVVEPDFSQLMERIRAGKSPYLTDEELRLQLEAETAGAAAGTEASEVKTEAARVAMGTVAGTEAKTETKTPAAETATVAKTASQASLDDVARSEKTQTTDGRQQ